MLSWGQRERVRLTTLVLYVSGCVYRRASLGVYKGKFVYMSRAWFVSMVCVEMRFCRSRVFGVFVMFGWGLRKKGNRDLLSVCMGSRVRVVVCMLSL